MNPDRLYACWFDAAPTGKSWPVDWYARHARVLQWSADQACPGWTVDVRKIAAAPRLKVATLAGNTPSYAYNTHKLKDWVAIVRKAADGDRLLICDADLMVLRDLSAVWETGDWDVAITEKRGRTRLPLNGGVVFTRINARSRAWWEGWLLWNMKLVHDAKLHNVFRATYAGMNQAALGAFLERGNAARVARMHELPCTRWNLESATWETFDPADPPYIVHVKGAMRRGLMTERHAASVNATTSRQRLAAIWRQFEAEAEKAGRHL